jgi:hypothetical protein
LFRDAIDVQVFGRKCNGLPGHIDEEVKKFRVQSSAFKSSADRLEQYLPFENGFVQGRRR